MQVPQSKAFIIQLPLIYPDKQTLIKFIYSCFIYLKQDINKPSFYVLNVWKHRWWCFCWKKTILCSYVKVNFLGLRLLFFSFFFLFLFLFLFFFSLFFFFIYIHIQHNASLTHVTSVGPIAPKSVDFRVLSVKTPLRA